MNERDAHAVAALATAIASSHSVPVAVSVGFGRRGYYADIRYSYAAYGVRVELMQTPHRIRSLVMHITDDVLGLN